MKMDEVHRSVTDSMSQARPSRFEYNWKDDRTLVIVYKSHRNLMDVMVGLIKGVGKYYGVELKVKKLSENRVEVVFSVSHERVN